MPDTAPEGRSTPAMLVIVNARIWTNDPRREWADAVLVRGDRLLAVGSSAELRKRAGRDARVIDARGMLARPRGPADTLAPGSPATLILVAGPALDPRAPVADESVVLALVDGRVELDRVGLAR
jgi:hypothetical protein